MTTRQPLPLLWLFSDQRNDAGLEDALARLPRGSGFVFRHYHLRGAARIGRYEVLRDAARAAGHRVIAARPDARMTDADGTYATPGMAAWPAGLRLAAAHDADEIAQAERAGADGIFLSPVFATRSHPGGATLGLMGFHILAQTASVPIIALGGMTAARAAQLDWPRWGAIDAFG